MRVDKEIESSLYSLSIVGAKGGGEIFVDNSKTGNETRYINHSHCPNTKYIMLEVTEYAAYLPCLVSTQTILPGSQMTVDYGYTYSSLMEDDLMVCLCDTANCPRVLASRQPPVGEPSFAFAQYIRQTSSYMPVSAFFDQSAKTQVGYIGETSHFPGDAGDFPWKPEVTWHPQVTVGLLNDPKFFFFLSLLNTSFLTYLVGQKNNLDGHENHFPIIKTKPW